MTFVSIACTSAIDAETLADPVGATDALDPKGSSAMP
jgi:hypothetical protein